MNKKSSYDKTNAARLKKVKQQKNRINFQIQKAEKSSKFQTTFFEEIYPENKTYLQNAGYKLITYGGPQNIFYTIIDWSTPDS